MTTNEDEKTMAMLDIAEKLGELAPTLRLKAPKAFRALADAVVHEMDGYGLSSTFIRNMLDIEMTFAQLEALAPKSVLDGTKLLNWLNDQESRSASLGTTTDGTARHRVTLRMVLADGKHEAIGLGDSLDKAFDKALISMGDSIANRKK